MAKRFVSDDPERDVSDLVALALSTKSRIFIGVDPGIRGALAAIAENPQINPVILDMPYLENQRITVRGGQRKVGVRRVYDLHKLLEWLDPIHSTTKVIPLVTMCLEQSQPRPEDTPVTAFSIGCGYQIWPMWATVFNISYEQVRPSVWKRRIGLKDAEKETSIIEAKRLFPRSHHYFQIKGDDGRAEALLLAEYGRRLRSGQLLAEQAQKENAKRR